MHTHIWPNSVLYCAQGSIKNVWNDVNEMFLKMNVKKKCRIDFSSFDIAALYKTCLSEIIARDKIKSECAQSATVFLILHFPK